MFLPYKLLRLLQAEVPDILLNLRTAIFMPFLMGVLALSVAVESLENIIIFKQRKIKLCVTVVHIVQ